MKRLWIILILMIGTSGVGAQIILEPKAAGTAYYYDYYYYRYKRYWTPTWSITHKWYTTRWNHQHGCYHNRMKIGLYVYHYIHWNPPTSYDYRHHETHWQGVIEFDLDSIHGERSVPTTQMTPYNWTAKIDNIVVENPVHVGQFMPVYLFDLNDSSEDGVITRDDYDSRLEDITTLFENIPEEGTIYNNIDITAALRRDLFGAGAGDPTTGFLFTAGAEASVEFDTDSPRISINLNTPTPSPTVTPTVTPTPTPWSGVQLFLSDDMFSAGEPFKLRALCMGEPGDTAADLYVILDVFGDYWFYPGWNPVPMCRRINLENGHTAYHFILDFIWPEGDFGHADGIYFWSAITTPGTFKPIGDLDCVVFGYD